MKIGWTLWYVGFLSFVMWQVETRGPIAIMIKGSLEYILGQELTWK